MSRHLSCLNILLNIFHFDLQDFGAIKLRKEEVSGIPQELLQTPPKQVGPGRNTEAYAAPSLAAAHTVGKEGTTIFQLGTRNTRRTKLEQHGCNSRSRSSRCETACSLEKLA